jgi:hypothetical protein
MVQKVHKIEGRSAPSPAVPAGIVRPNRPGCPIERGVAGSAVSGVIETVLVYYLPLHNAVKVK